jgi:hypothetical protein
MSKFKNFLNESYINVFTTEDKEKYVDVVWKMLLESYKEIGGLKGSGFSSKQDMIKSLPFWKVIKHNNEVKAVIMYKDKKGRKLVALATDQTADAKQLIVSTMKEEFSRSYFEVSHGLRTFIMRNMPDLYKKYLIKFDDAISKGLLDPNEVSKIDEYTYDRVIGGTTIEKNMLGTINLNIH